MALETVRDAWAADVILRDGGTLRLRPPPTADSEALVAFLGAPPESTSSPFHAAHAQAGADDPFLAPILCSSESTGCVALDRRIGVCRPARSSGSESW